MNINLSKIKGKRLGEIIDFKVIKKVFFFLKILMIEIIFI